MGQNKMEPLFDTVKQIAEKKGSLYRDRMKDRDELLAFMDDNEWFQAPHLEKDGEFLTMISEDMRTAFDIWAKAYRKTDGEKMEIIHTLLTAKYPRTGERLSNYFAVSGSKTTRSAWKVLDFLFAGLTKELDEYADEEINALVSSAYEELKMKELSLLADCLAYKGSEVPYTSWKYQFKSHQIARMENSAYHMEDFAFMAYAVLNRKSWDENELIQKALDNKRYAQLWTFSAFHFICALRTTDMIRLPIPALPYEPETIRMMIRESRFSMSDAYDIAFELQYRCRMRGKRPHKTAKRGIAPEIKLFIPESLMEPLGFIMAISLSFRESGDPFVSTDFTLQDLIRFFGEDFARAAGYKRFQTRRANKAYLQGIEATAEDTPGKPKGYMLASLARSHKGGIGKLAEITDVYLRDAKFSNSDPGFIIREMFERGILVKVSKLYIKTVLSF